MTSTGEPGNASGIPRRVMRAAVAVHQADAHLVIVTIFLRPKRTRISSPSLFPATVAIAANYESEGARSWFASTNPDLDWRSPLVFIRAALQQEQLDRLVQVAAQDAR